MELEPESSAPYARPAPPTMPGALPEQERRSKWPVILGVIGIIFGVLGVLGAAWSIVSFSVLKNTIPFAPAQMASQMAEIQRYTVISGLIGLPVATLLTVVGVGLTTRRAWAATGAKAWAIAHMLAVLIGIPFTLRIQQASLSGNPAMTQGGAPKNVIAVAQGMSICFSLVLGWGIPIFVLIWFSRAKIKAEIASWR